MIRHTLLSIYRSFKRFKSVFLINLAGLSTGLASVILIYLWVNDELRMDKFHANDHRLFQVMTNQNRPDNIVTLGHGPGQLQDELPAEFPEIEYAIGSTGVTTNLTLSVEGKKLNAPGQFAGEHFFKVFSYPLLHGQPDQVLHDKRSIVLSENMAAALFGTTDNVVGRTMQWEVPGMEEDVIVTGIFKNIGNSSSEKFDFALSYEVYEDFMRSIGSLSWGNHNAVTYVLLKENADVSAVNARIEHFIKKRDPNSIITLFLKPYSDNYLYGQYENGIVVGGRITYVRLFSAIAVFILVIACINFMNLATAKASRRMREVGVKKALGATRRTLMMQYLGESLLMSAIAMGVAVLMVDVFLPQFNLITGKNLSLPLDGDLVGVLVIITIITGLLAGSYPALYLSGFHPAAILKGKLETADGERWARKGLVVFQFALAIIFIASVWIVYLQMEFVQTKHLGYDRDNVVHFKVEGNVGSKLDTFLEEVKSIPGVAEASAMRGSVMGRTSFTTGSFNWKGMDPNVVIQFEHLGIYYGLIELLGIEVAEGRTFSRKHPSDSLGIIFNETAIEVMGLEDPVGETFSLWGTEYTIVGVVKDFHFQTFHEEVKPLFFRITDDFNKVMVRIDAGQERQTLANLDAFYKKFNPGYIFDYEFLNEEYQTQYVAEQRVAKLSKYFAALAILICCLGLFGLASFTAERRLKEIGIRKVLGSTVIGIVYLLSRDFNKIVAVAVVIALPLSYFAARMWLDTFVYHIDLHWWYFAAAGVMALVIAWITVGMQAWKAARVNPVKCLRDE